MDASCAERVRLQFNIQVDAWFLVLLYVDSEFGRDRKFLRFFLVDFCCIVAEIRCKCPFGYLCDYYNCADCRLLIRSRSKFFSFLFVWYMLDCQWFDTVVFWYLFEDYVVGGSSNGVCLLCMVCLKACNMSLFVVQLVKLRGLTEKFHQDYFLLLILFLTIVYCSSL